MSLFLVWRLDAYHYCRRGRLMFTTAPTLSDIGASCLFAYLKVGVVRGVANIASSLCEVWAFVSLAWGGGSSFLSVLRFWASEATGDAASSFSLALQESWEHSHSQNPQDWVHWPTGHAVPRTEWTWNYSKRQCRSFWATRVPPCDSWDCADNFAARTVIGSKTPYCYGRGLFS